MDSGSAPAADTTTCGAAAVVVTAAAAATKRVVGATAWLVLEQLALQVEPAGDGAVVVVSVRSLGTVLRLDKDTVARAIERLVDVGIVARGRVSKWGTELRVQRCDGLTVMLTSVQDVV